MGLIRKIRTIIADFIAPSVEGHPTKTTVVARILAQKANNNYEFYDSKGSFIHGCDTVEGRDAHMEYLKDREDYFLKESNISYS